MTTTKIKPTKRNALAAIARIEAELDTNGDSYIIDAPTGYVFNANNEHTYLIGYYDPEAYDPVTMPDIWEHAIETAELGVRKCDGDCSAPWDWHKDVQPPAPTRADYEAAQRTWQHILDTATSDESREQAQYQLNKISALIAAA